MNNNRQSADVVLTTYGGLCVEVAATDLPEGASPQNWDVDYDVGAVFTRSGLKSAYQFVDLNSGVLFAGNSASIAGAWAFDGVFDTTTFSGTSDIIFWNQFPIALSPAIAVTGVEIQLSGHYTGSVAPTVTVQLILNGEPIGMPESFQFQTGDSIVTVGSPTDGFSANLSADIVNNITFGYQVFGTVPVGNTASLFIRQAVITIFQSQGPDNINWIKTFVEDDGETHTFVLDSDGTLWEENVTENPGVLVPELETIYPNQCAYSETNQDEEWIAFSDLLHGTNIPRHGTNFDRISQVGPGLAPSCAGNAGTCAPTTGTTDTGQNSCWTIASITQIPAQGSATGQPFQDVLWSAGPTSTNPGNTLTIFYRPGTVPPGPDPSIVIGQGINLTGLTGDFLGLNGTYIVTDTGFATPPGGGSNRWMFTVQTVTTSPARAQAHGTTAGNFQPTLATMTLTPDRPANFQVGDQITIQNATPSQWNNTWTILNLVNGGQYSITQTSLTAGVATYDFSIISGNAPTVGSLVNITGCINGPFVNGSSIFNQTNVPITTATGSTFTINIPGFGDVGSAIEANATAVELGTQFQFDPAPSFLGLPGAVFGNDTGTGQVFLNTGLGAGVRQAVTIFETRNGYLTAPSPPVTFGTTTADSSIRVTNICVGPPNVVARIIAFTPANGGNFFYLPEDVTIPNAGQPLTYKATRIPNNTNQDWAFTFTDAVLMAATAIDIPGNNLFNQLEVGACRSIVSYADRNFYVHQNNRVQNFINTTFDGGYVTHGEFNYPAGWTPEPNVNALGGRIKLSPVFGFSYYIVSDGSNADGIYGGIHQSAFQDAYMVPILRPQVGYSIRIDIRSPSGITDQGGQLFLDVVSYQQNGLYGSAGFPLPSMSTNFQTLVLPLVPKGALPLSVPDDLLLRLYASHLPAGADVEIDRFEIYPTDRPDLTTQVFGSYVGNLEAVDGVSGNLDAGGQNNQPVVGLFRQYDLLYFLKTGSMFSTQDSANEEPAEWGIRQVSDKVGCCGIHAFDYGEEWMITANRLGLYLFHGGEPQKILQEIQPIWNALNWKFSHTIIVRNDVQERRITIHVPLPTPNKWMPDAVLNPSPETPNCMLMCNYKELQNANDLIERGPVKVSYSGKLISWDISRKWSIWQIPSPYSASITRPDGTDQYFIGNGRHNAKVYQLDANTLDDDGIPINGLYCTYGFPKTEQAQQYGPLLGQYRKLYRYSSHNLAGDGKVRLRALVNDLVTPHPYVVPGGIDLHNASVDNREVPFNLTAQRLFLEYSTNALAAHFRLSETILSIVKDPWAPVRGLN